LHSAAWLQQWGKSTSTIILVETLDADALPHFGYVIAR
jgi:hypothetical protein